MGVRPGLSSRRIVVLSHRDSLARPGLAELSGTAAMLELARLFRARELRKTLVLVSTSGATEGFAGARAWAESAAGGPIDAVLLLGDVAGVRADKPWVVPWSLGSGPAPLALQRTVENAVRAEVGRPGGSRATAQWIRRALPLTVSEQGVVADASAARRADRRLGRARPAAGRAGAARPPAPVRPRVAARRDGDRRRRAGAERPRERRAGVLGRPARHRDAAQRAAGLGRPAAHRHAAAAGAPDRARRLLPRPPAPRRGDAVAGVARHDRAAGAAGVAVGARARRHRSARTAGCADAPAPAARPRRRAGARLARARARARLVRCAAAVAGASRAAREPGRGRARGRHRGGAVHAHRAGLGRKSRTRRRCSCPPLTCGCSPLPRARACAAGRERRRSASGCCRSWSWRSTTRPR